LKECSLWMELKGSPPKPLNTTFDNNSSSSVGKDIEVTLATC